MNASELAKYSLQFAPTDELPTLQELISDLCAQLDGKLVMMLYFIFFFFVMMRVIYPRVKVQVKGTPLEKLAPSFYNMSEFFMEMGLIMLFVFAHIQGMYSLTADIFLSILIFGGILASWLETRQKNKGDAE